MGPAVIEISAARAGDASVDTGGGTLCSPASVAAPVTVTFENHTTATSIDLTWVDPQCHESLYTTIPPQMGYRQATYAGHVWRLRDQASQALLREVAVDASATTVVYP